MGNNMVTANRGKGTEGNKRLTANRGKGTEGEQEEEQCGE